MWRLRWAVVVHRSGNELAAKRVPRRRRNAAGCAAHGVLRLSSVLLQLAGGAGGVRWRGKRRGGRQGAEGGGHDAPGGFQQDQQRC